MAAKVEDNEYRTRELFEEFYGKLENRIKDLSSQLNSDFIPKTEEKLKQNVFKTLIVSFCAGFIVGVILMFIGIIRGKKR